MTFLNYSNHHVDSGFFDKFKNYFYTRYVIFMVRSLFLISVLTILSLAAMAQGAPQVKKPGQEESKGILYNKEFSFGARLASNGWGIFAETGKIINIYRTRVFQFEVADIRHPKEKKQSAEILPLAGGISSPRDFYFGKQNEFFVLRAGFGYKRNIAEKAQKSGVKLALVYVGGVSLGILKPYYLELAHFEPVPGDTNTYQLTAVSERYEDNPETGNADRFLNWWEILGASPYGKGFNKMGVVPGVYGKFALNFEWGARDNFITALEAGVMADIYYKRVPIMIKAENKPFFFAAYISVQVGRRK